MIVRYVLTLIGVSATLSVGLFVFLLRREMRLNKLYLLLSLVIGLYSITDIGLLTAGTTGAAFALHKLLSVELFVYPVVLHMMLSFRHRVGISGFLAFSLYIPAIVLMYVDHSTAQLSGHLLHSDGLNLRFMSWNLYTLIAFLWEMGILSFVLVSLFFFERSETNKEIKAQANYLFLSLSTMFVLGIIAQMTLTSLDMPVNFVKAIGFSLSALLILPAVKKYHLFTLMEKDTAKKIISVTSELLVFVDINGHIADANPAFQNLMGADRSKLVGMKFDSLLVHESFFDLKQILTVNPSITIETRLKLPDIDEYRDVQLSASYVSNTQGQPIGVLLIGRDETRQRRTAFALVEKERRFRMLLNSTDDMIMVYPLDGERPDCFVEVNNVACEVLGYTKSEWEHLTIFDVTVDQEATKEYLHRIFRDKKTLRELDFKSRHGKTIPFENNSHAIEMDGRMMVITIARDITERRITKDMIHVMENAIDSSISSIFFTDLEGDITWVNESFMRLWGISDDELVIGHNISEFFLAYGDMINSIKRNGRFFGELRGIDRSRDSFIIQIAAHSFKHKSGETIGIMASCIDVTDARKAENALRESKRNYQTLVEKSRIAIAVENSEGQPLFFNERFPDILGLRSHEITEKGIPSVIGLTHGMKPEVKPINVDLQTKASDGTQLFLNADILPVREDGQLKGWRYYIRDDTERHMMEQELLRTEKLESIGILAGGIAHDFNNVLTAITGNLGLARLKLERGGDALSAIKETEEQAIRAKLLTEQLLTFAKGGAPIKENASIKEVIKETVQFALRGSGIKPEFRFEDNLPRTSFDPGQFSQVMSNLAFNAKDAMNGSGSFIISVEKALLDGDTTLSLKAGEYISITVSDSGQGIPPENIERIFEPYFTTKQKGNGLGLATSFSIVKRHGGHMEVTSEQGKGTTFNIYMPIAEGDGRTAFKEEEPELTAGAGRILIMDDDNFIREIAESLLEQLGYDVTSSECGEEAVDLYVKALDTGKPFDLCIFDLTVPGGMGGREAIKRIKEIDGNVKAIVSSGYSNDPIMSDYMKYGFCDVVVKPYRIEQLADSVSRLLSKKAA